MAIAFVAQDFQKSTNGTSVTSTPVNNTGSNFGLCVVGSLNTTSYSLTPSAGGDSWVQIGQLDNDYVRGTLYVCYNPTISATYSLAVASTSGAPVPTIAVLFGSGGRLPDLFGQMDTVDDAVSNSTTFSSFTPDENNTLVVTFAVHEIGTGGTVSGFTVDSGATTGGQSFGGGVGYVAIGGAFGFTPAWLYGVLSGKSLGWVIQLNSDAASIRVDEVQDGTVYARKKGTEYQEIALTGIYSTGGTADDPTTLEIQALERGSSTVLQDWTTPEDIVASANIWSATYRLRAHKDTWVRLQARWYDPGTDAYVTGAITSNRLAVGLALGGIGQSNMELMSNAFTPSTANDLTSVYTLATGWTEPTGNGMVMLLDKIQEATGYIVGLLQFAVSGSGMIVDNGAGMWTDFDETVYNAFIGAMLDTTGSLDAIFLSQGEAEVYAGADATEWAEGVCLLQRQLSIALDREPGEWLLGIWSLGKYGGTELNATDDQVDSIRQAQINLSRNTHGMFHAGSNIDNPLQSATDVHYTQVGYENMARRGAQGLLHYLGYTAYGNNGPRLDQGCARLVDSTHIRIVPTHELGRTLSGLTGSTSLTGWSVEDDGVSTNVTAAEIVGDEIHLTTDAVTGSTVTVQYMGGKTPTTTNILSDDTRPQGSSTGRPLIPSQKVQAALSSALTDDAIEDLGDRLAAAAGAMSPTNVDKDHTWTFDNPNQTTSPKIVTELIGFDGLLSMDFSVPIPARSVINSVTSATFANTSGTEPLVTESAMTMNKKGVNITVDAANATAGTYTLSVKVVTTDSQTFVRSGRLTVT